MVRGRVSGLALVLGALVLGALAAAVAVSVLSGPAEAAFPGENGRIAFEKPDGTETNDYEIYTTNPDGSGRIQITDNQVDDLDPAFSPDGRSLLYSVLSVDGDPEGGGETGIYRVDLAANGKPSGGRKLLVSGDDRFVAFPSWSPDGKQIVFSRNPEEGESGDQFDIYRTKSNGEGNATFVADAGPFDAYPAWSPNGGLIAFSGTFLLAGQSFVYVVPVDGSEPPLPITDPEEGAYGPNWSPDGRRIAYAGLPDESESPLAYQIFTRAVGGGGRLQVTDQESVIGVFPAYSPEGDQIAFRALLVPGSSLPSSLQSVAPTLDERDLAGLVASGSADRVGTLGRGEPETLFGVGRVPSDGGRERPVPGTESGGDESGLFLGLIVPGPDWGQQAKQDGGGGGRPECTIRGTSAGEAINGTEGRDVICAGGGGDSINALGGDDVVFGGPGDDSLNGNAGRDDLFGEGGNDSLNGGPDRDRLVGGPGRDTTRQ